MNIIDIIVKKKNKEELSEEEIKYVVEGYVNGTIKDYQMSSLLMAITINGMTDDETIYLTKYMILSGDKLDLSSITPLVDKHSTGGVGDKTTLIIAPIVASLGCHLAKMSGRGLGITGGTIDKLESIPGFNTSLSYEDFIQEIKDIGMAITSQTDTVAIADKKIYALRDVTGTTESIPLIASSIMSKKIASGSKNLVIDIKVGEGALIKNIEDAKHLAKLMLKIGKANNIKMICILSNMDIPLGSAIGNSLEVLEAADILYYNTPSNLLNLCIILASYMTSLGLNINLEDAKDKVTKSLEDKTAYKKFLEFVKYQKGDIKKISKAKYTYEIKSDKEGYLGKISSLELARLSGELGASRKNKEDKIDYSVGILINKNLNDKVNKGDTIITLHTNKKELPKIKKDKLFTITENKEPYKLIYGIIKN